MQHIKNTTSKPLSRFFFPSLPQSKFAASLDVISSFNSLEYMFQSTNMRMRGMELCEISSYLQNADNHFD